MPGIDHVVWFGFKDGTTEAEKQACLDAIASLKDSVPVVQELSVGPNLTDRAPAPFTHGLIVRFASMADLTAYLEHPEHVRVRDEVMKPIMATKPIVMDCEAVRHPGAAAAKSSACCANLSCCSSTWWCVAGALAVGVAAGALLRK